MSSTQKNGYVAIEEARKAGNPALADIIADALHRSQFAGAQGSMQRQNARENPDPHWPTIERQIGTTDSVQDAWYAVFNAETVEEAQRLTQAAEALERSAAPR